MQCRENKPFCSSLYFQRLQFRERQIRTEKLQASKLYYVAVKKVRTFSDVYYRVTDVARSGVFPDPCSEL